MHARSLLVVLVAALAVATPGLTGPAVADASPPPGSATLAGAPDAPVILSVVPGRKSLQVTWKVPADNGSPINEWAIDASRQNGSGVLLHYDVAVGLHEGDTVTRTLTGITNGLPVKISVAASNDVWATWSVPFDFVAPQGIPDAPVSLATTRSNQTVGLTWVAPHDTGGVPLTGYTVTLTPSSGGAPRTVSVGPGASAASFTGLVNGASYALSVVATNALGDSPSAAPDAAVVAAGAPAKPGKPPVTAGKGFATIGWKAPTASGSSITSFQVRCSNGVRKTVSASARSLKFTGLAKNKKVSFKVRAVNAVGAGLYSLASSVVTVK